MSFGSSRNPEVPETTAAADPAAELSAAIQALRTRQSGIRSAAESAASRYGLPGGLGRFAQDAGLDEDEFSHLNTSHLNAAGFGYWTEQVQQSQTALDGRVRQAVYDLQSRDHRITDRHVDEFFQAAGIDPGPVAYEVTVGGRATFRLEKELTRDEAADLLRSAIEAAGGQDVRIVGTSLDVRRVRS